MSLRLAMLPEGLPTYADNDTLQQCTTMMTMMDDGQIMIP